MQSNRIKLYLDDDTLNNKVRCMQIKRIEHNNCTLCCGVCVVRPTQSSLGAWPILMRDNNMSSY